MIHSATYFDTHGTIIRLVSKAYYVNVYSSLICFRYQLDDGPMCVETCSWVYHCFI